MTDSVVAGTTVQCSTEFRDENHSVLGTQSVTIHVPIELEATPEVGTNELGVSLSHTITATVTSGVMPVPGALVNFAVLSGPNVGQAGNAVTDVAGRVTFQYNGVQGPAGAGLDLIQVCSRGACDDIQKLWQDTTPPLAACVPTVNPAGSNTPPAGQHGTPQNPDGFWAITGDDLVDPNPTITVVDTGSGTVFGPFPSGTRIKYVQAPGANPTILAGSGAIDWRIKGKGDAKVVVTDFAGNAASAMCLVPPPPM